MNHRVLVVDDDPTLLKSLRKVLLLRNYFVDTLDNPLKIDEYLQKNNYDCILLDVKMPGQSGLEILDKIHEKNVTTPVIMISGYSDVDAAVKSIKAGAYDYIEKPIDPERLFVTLKNAIHKSILFEHKENLSKELAQERQMVVRSPKMREVFQRMEKVLNIDATVLILGETGVGKELIAWALHHKSERQGKPFIRINCAAIPSDLLESELFGHRKGSFTGAVTDKKGKLLEANGGTIFLDEIGDMELRLQAKMLRVLENREAQVLGETLPRQIDARFITASNKNLMQMTKDGKFREDLYHRINVINISIPPLRERLEDILPLAYYFIQHHCSEYNKQVLSISRQAESILLKHSWPGNVRELKNIMEKLVILSEKSEIAIDDVLCAIEEIEGKTNTTVDEHDQLPLRSAHDAFEKKYIIQALNRANWKITETARVLGIDRSNLFKKMRKLEIGRN